MIRNFCKMCGARLGPDAEFCPACGCRLEPQAGRDSALSGTACAGRFFSRCLCHTGRAAGAERRAACSAGSAGSARMAACRGCRRARARPIPCPRRSSPARHGRRPGARGDERAPRAAVFFLCAKHRFRAACANAASLSLCARILGLRHAGTAGADLDRRLPWHVSHQHDPDRGADLSHHSGGRQPVAAQPPQFCAWPSGRTGHCDRRCVRTGDPCGDFDRHDRILLLLSSRRKAPGGNRLQARRNTAPAPSHSTAPHRPAIQARVKKLDKTSFHGINCKEGASPQAKRPLKKKRKAERE